MRVKKKSYCGRLGYDVTLSGKKNDQSK